jgi:spermidine synthase
MAVQSGAPFYQARQLQDVCGRLASSFAAVRPFLAPVPTYAGGMLALVAAGGAHRALRPPAKVLRERHQRVQPRTRYYTPPVHRAAFVIPPVFMASEAPESDPEPECPANGGEASPPTH